MSFNHIKSGTNHHNSPERAYANEPVELKHTHTHRETTGGFMWLTGLRIQCCRRNSLGCCYSVGSIPGLGTSEVKKINISKKTVFLS